MPSAPPTQPWVGVAKSTVLKGVSDVEAPGSTTGCHDFPPFVVRRPLLAIGLPLTKIPVPGEEKLTSAMVGRLSAELFKCQCPPASCVV
jgi:hypothetical protein